MARVVFVDDDPVAREVAGDALRAEGHEVRVVHNGAALLQQLLIEPAEVILLDVNMPGMSGDRLAQTLRKSLEPPFPSILLFSGMPAGDLRRLARELGVTGWVRKGCARSELLRSVDAAAQLYRQNCDQGEGATGDEPAEVDPGAVTRIREPER